MKLKIKDILSILSRLIPDIEGKNELMNYELDEVEMGKAFGTALKRLRNYKQISLNALSKEVDIPNPSISRYENGLVVPTIPQAMKLTTFFDLPIELFIYIGVMGTMGVDIEKYYEEYIQLIKQNNNQNREQRRKQKKK